jgi:hypothetical protein
MRQDIFCAIAWPPSPLLDRPRPPRRLIGGAGSSAPGRQTGQSSWRRFGIAAYLLLIQLSDWQDCFAGKDPVRCGYIRRTTLVSLLPESAWRGVFGSCPIHLVRLYSVYGEILYRTGKSLSDYMSDNGLFTIFIALVFVTKTFFRSDNREYSVLLAFIGHLFPICRSLQEEQEVFVILCQRDGFRHAKCKKRTPLA